MSSNSPSHIIHEAKRLVESERRSEIRLNANGGNSILMVCEPMEEVYFINQLKDDLPIESFSIIDLSKCLLEFVDEHQNELPGLYDQLQSTTHEIFKAPAKEESPDLFKKIVTKIQQVFDQNKVPVLINTGALYGTGIHNIQIMENEVIMKASLPLIILYPSTIEPDKIMFLGHQPSSKYRCMIIN